eukprot:COSAG02_NODE_3202_length_7181_cov_25.177210_3_plen_510_part_00
MGAGEVMAASHRVGVALVVHGGDNASNKDDPPCLELVGDGHTVRYSGAIPGVSRDFRFERVIGDLGRPDDDCGALVRDSVAEAMGGGRAVIAAIGAVGTGKTRTMGLLPPFGCDGVLQAVFRCLFAALDRRGASDTARPRVGVSFVEVDGHKVVDLVGPTSREARENTEDTVPLDIGFDTITGSTVQLALDEDTREEQAVSLIERACQNRRYIARGASPSHSLTHAIVTIAVEPAVGALGATESFGCIQLLDLCPVSATAHSLAPEAQADHALCGLRTLTHNLAALAGDGNVSHLPDLHERNHLWTSRLFRAVLAAGARLHVLACVRGDADAGGETSAILDYATRCQGMSAFCTGGGGIDSIARSDVEPEPEPAPGAAAEDLAQIYAAIASTAEMSPSEAASEVDHLESRGEHKGASLLRAAVQTAAALEVSRQQASDEAAELSSQLAELRVELLNAKLHIADYELRGVDDGGSVVDEDSNCVPTGFDSAAGRTRSGSDMAMIEKARRY